MPVLVAPPVAGPPRSIAAAGDSFNTGFAALPKSGDNPDLSWSTGTSADVASVYSRLVALSPGLGHRSLLVARDGSKVSDLPRQFRPCGCLSRASGDSAVGWQRRLLRSRRVPRDTRGLLPASVEAAFEIARERMPDARIFVTSLTDEARWNDRSATIPGNDSKLSDGTLCDPQLDANGAPIPRAAQADPGRRAAL